MSVLSCFPFRRRAKSVCCLRFIKLPLKNSFSTEFWRKLAADYNSQVFQSFEMKRRASSAQKQHRDSFLAIFFGINCHLKHRTLGVSRRDRQRRKFCNYCSEIWVEMEINSGPPLNQTSVACRTLHPNCVISSGKRCPTVVGENKKILDRKSFSYFFSLFAHSREKVFVELRENF